MSLRRSIFWNAALRDLHSDRMKIPAGFLSARARVEGVARRRRPLIVADAFDRAAIMAAAVIAAKAHQERYGATWSEAMSVALKAAWQVAKAARQRGKH